MVKQRRVADQEMKNQRRTEKELRRVGICSCKKEQYIGRRDVSYQRFNTAEVDIVARYVTVEELDRCMLGCLDMGIIALQVQQAGMLAWSTLKFTLSMNMISPKDCIDLAEAEVRRQKCTTQYII
jgi:hypothetical protein